MKEYETNVLSYSIIPDDKEIIQKEVRSFEQKGCNLVIITGGTGLSPRDVTPDAIKPLLDIEVFQKQSEIMDRTERLILCYREVWPAL